MGSELRLYVNRAATTSRSVLAFCEAENIDIEIVDVDIMSGEHHQPRFTRLNPNRLVPVLEDGDFVLTEASAILRYLARKVNSPMYPDDLREQARVDELLAWFEANLYRDFGFHYVYPQVLPHHARASDEGTQSTIDWGREKSKAWLQVLDQHFLANQKPFLLGEGPTIADFFGMSILSLSELVRCDLSVYPQLQRWYERVSRHPSWQHVNPAFKGFAASLEGQTFAQL